MSDHKPHKTTADNLALAQARKEKKLKQALEASAIEANVKPSGLLHRPWLALSSQHCAQDSEFAAKNVKILTWNLLAQCLVRRDLFPTSDCLKVAQRESLIHDEIRRQDAQIICLQEVDRLEKLLPMLEKSGYSHHYASGPRKKHRCLIGYKKNLFSFISEKTVYYDEQHVGAAETAGRIGSSFKTKNIGYMIAIKNSANPKEGVIVATAHLFWHPKYTYERIRQTAILMREVVAFRESLEANTWPCIMAGDFNYGPSDPGYSLLTGDSLLPSQEELILPSMVVHSSIDPTVLTTTNPSQPAKGDDEENAVDADRVITSARAADEKDGLLSVQELIDWFSLLPNARSIYAHGLLEARKLGNKIPSYGDRAGLPDGRNGAHEPEYTSYTHYWQAVLDYIFVLEPSAKPVHINGLLTPLTGEDMAPGLPQKHVSGSDHTCLVADLTW